MSVHPLVYPALNVKALRTLLRSQQQLIAQRMMMEALGEGQLGVNSQVVWQLMAQNMYRSGDIPLLAVRETLQNSVDAIRAAYRSGQLKQGKGLFKVTTSEDFSTLIIEDNGIGMDLETLQTKFLVLGESGKGAFADSEQAIGGFGVAKAVILAASQTFHWKLETRDLMAESKSVAEPIQFYRMKEYLQGTRLTLYQLSDQHRYIGYGPDSGTLSERLARMLACNVLPDVKLHLNGKPIVPVFVKGGNPYPVEAARWPSGVEGTLHLFKSPKVGARTGLFVLLEGLFQFRLSFVDNIEHVVVVNLRVQLSPKSSQYPFSAGRDQLRGKVALLIDHVLQTLISEHDVSSRESFVLLQRHRLSDRKQLSDLRELFHGQMPEWARAFSRFSPLNEKHPQNRWAQELRRLIDPSDKNPPLFSALGIFYRRDWLEFKELASPISDEQYDATSSKTLKGLERYRDWIRWALRRTKWRSVELDEVQTWMKSKARAGMVSPQQHVQLLTVLGDYTKRIELAQEQEQEDFIPEEVLGFQFGDHNLLNPMEMLGCVLLSSKPDDEQSRATIWTQYQHMMKFPVRYFKTLIAWDYILTRIHVMHKSNHQLIWQELEPGLLLEDDTLGMYMPHKAPSPMRFRGLLLCNPVMFLEYMQEHINDPFRVASYLYHVAVHEYVHASGYPHHDQRFVYARESLGNELISLIFDLSEVLVMLFRFDKSEYCSPRVLDQLREERSKRERQWEAVSTELTSLKTQHARTQEQLAAVIAQAFRDANAVRGETQADMAREMLRELHQGLRATEDPVLVDEVFAENESALLSHLYVLLCTELAS